MKEKMRSATAAMVKTDRKQQKTNRLKRYFSRLNKDLRKNPGMYLMSLPAFVLIFIFSYIPMVGVLMAFQDYTVAGGIFGSQWIGLFNFELFFSSYYFSEVLFNTLAISLYSLMVGFTFPILFALVLNSVKIKFVKAGMKVLSYIPYFISTVIIVSLLKSFFDPSYGVVNVFLESLGLQSVDFMNEPRFFRSLFVWSDLWQSMGWSSIIYISVLGGVSRELYDAAEVDGANKLRVLVHIDFPALLPTIIMLGILAIGGILGVAFEKIYLMQSGLNLSVSEVISTYVYKIGVVGQDYGFGAAVGLFNSVIGFILLCIANILCRKFTEYSLW